MCLQLPPTRWWWLSSALCLGSFPSNGFRSLLLQANSAKLYWADSRIEEEKNPAGIFFSVAFTKVLAPVSDSNVVTMVGYRLSPVTADRRPEEFDHGRLMRFLFFPLLLELHPVRLKLFGISDRSVLRNNVSPRTSRLNKCVLMTLFFSTCKTRLTMTESGRDRAEAADG